MAQSGRRSTPTSASSQQDIRQRLEFLLDEDGDEEEYDRPPQLSGLHQKLIAYAQRKGGWLKVRDTKKNWGDNNDVPYSQVEQLIEELVAFSLAVFSEDGTLWTLK